MYTEASRLTSFSKPRAEIQTPKEQPRPTRRSYTCDICGAIMEERNCKVICKNCGNRFDCSDLTIHLD